MSQWDEINCGFQPRLKFVAGFVDRDWKKCASIIVRWIHKLSKIAMPSLTLMIFSINYTTSNTSPRSISPATIDRLLEQQPIRNLFKESWESWEACTASFTAIARTQVVCTIFQMHLLHRHYRISWTCHRSRRYQVKLSTCQNHYRSPTILYAQGVTIFSWSCKLLPKVHQELQQNCIAINRCTSESIKLTTSYVHSNNDQGF